MGLVLSVEMIWAKLDERWKMHRGDVSPFNQGQMSTKTPPKINSEYQSKEVGCCCCWLGCSPQADVNE